MGYLASTNETTYEEFKWSRYHRTGRRAVLFVAKQRQRANLSFSNSLKNVAECHAVARDTIAQFSLSNGDEDDRNNDNAASSTSAPEGTDVRKRVVTNPATQSQSTLSGKMFFLYTF